MAKSKSKYDPILDYQDYHTCMGDDCCTYEERSEARRAWSLAQAARAVLDIFRANGPETMKTIMRSVRRRLKEEGNG